MALSQGHWVWRTVVAEQRYLLREIALVEDAIDRIGVPTVVITGTHDVVVPPRVAVALAGADSRRPAGDRGPDRALRAPGRRRGWWRPPCAGSRRSWTRPWKPARARARPCAAAMTVARTASAASRGTRRRRRAPDPPAAARRARVQPGRPQSAASPVAEATASMIASRRSDGLAGLRMMAATRRPRRRRTSSAMS